MAILYIRDIDDKVCREIKSAAALRGLTLREYVLLKLGEPIAEANRIPDVPAKPAIRADARREPVPVAVTARPTPRELAAKIPGVSTGIPVRCQCGDPQSDHRNGTGRCFGKSCMCDQFVKQE